MKARRGEGAGLHSSTLLICYPLLTVVNGAPVPGLTDCIQGSEAPGKSMRGLVPLQDFAGACSPLNDRPLQEFYI